MSSPGVSRGSCFGFAVDSSVPLLDLREPATDLPALTIREADADAAAATPGGAPIAEWAASPTVPWPGRLHRSGSGWDLRVDGAGWFRIDPRAGVITVPPTTDPLRREERLWSVPAILCLLARGDLPLHAAAVEIDGQAVILAGPRGSGKSTLAAGLIRAGHRLLSEDVVGLRPGTHEILPGPAMIRLRHDVAAWLDVPGATVAGHVDDRVHLVLDAESRADGAARPVAGIVVLAESGTGDPGMPIDATSAVAALWPLASQMPGRDGVAQRFELVVDVARAVPAFRLASDAGPAGLASTVAAVEGLARALSRSS